MIASVEEMFPDLKTLDVNPVRVQRHLIRTGSAGQIS